LDAIKPALVVLTESELWPNFLAAAKARNIPVVVVNARMSPRSFRRLLWVGGLAHRLLFGNVTRFAVQEQEYADRLRELGVPAEELTVAGSIKYDGALKARNTAPPRGLRELLSLSCPAPRRDLVLLAGSTPAPEESIILGVSARLRDRFPHLRLVLVPRHPDRFEEAARLVEQSGLPF